MAKKIGILTSGGDAPGMNTAIRACVRAALYAGLEVYGIKNGFEGLLNGEIEKMNRSSVGGILHRGGTVLYTARSERFKTEEGVNQALMMAQNFGLSGITVIGGDGSMRGAAELAKRGMNMIFIPCSIDNDIGYTDYTVGFDTAVNTVLALMSNIRDTSSSHNRTIIIEVMGRNCGDIALAAGLAGGAESILVPEIPYNVNDVCRKLIEGKNIGKRHDIIVKAEGSDMSASELAKIVRERTGSDTKVVILSYIQRGGSPSARDRLLASEMGYKAAMLMAEEDESRAIGVAADRIVSYPLEDAMKVKKEFKKEYLKMADILA